MYLEKINKPKDINKLSNEELKENGITVEQITEDIEKMINKK